LEAGRICGECLGQRDAITETARAVAALALRRSFQVSLSVCPFDLRVGVIHGRPLFQIFQGDDERRVQRFRRPELSAKSLRDRAKHQLTVSLTHYATPLRAEALVAANGSV